MPRGFLILVCFSFIQAIHSQSIEVKLSPVMGMFNLLETLQGATGTSPTLRKQAEDQLPGEVWQQALQDYQNLRTEYQFIRDGYPPSRKVILSTRKLLMLAAAHASDLQDFQTRITGILPNQDMIKLIRILKTIEPYYLKIFWDPYRTVLENMQNEMTSRAPRILPLFKQAKAFYQTAWPESLPFIVNLYPIPALEGNTAATPYGNVLVCGFLTRHPGAAGHLESIIVHEMCHLLYEEQSQQVQNNIDTWFATESSPYRSFAYSYLDEGLATAIGNGWAEKELHGQLDTAQWYNDPTINGFAKALYPMIENYFSQNRVLDQPFVHQAVAAFAQSFPKSLFSFENLLNEVNVYVDDEDPVAIQQVMSTIRAHFIIRNAWAVSPITAGSSLDRLKNGLGTHLIIVDRNQPAVLTKINQEIPALRSMLNGLKITGETVLTHLDEASGTTYIICILQQPDHLDRAMAQLAEHQYLDVEKPAIPIH